MNYRLATILAKEAVNADGTKVIDLNLINSVSQIQVLYESTAVGSGEPDALASACITKIELIDGSDVLFSLSGYETQGLDWYHRKQEPANVHKYLNLRNAEVVFNMNFGRYLWDPVLAFDPTKFTNPQLRITIDMGAGGCQSVAGELAVVAHVFDEKLVTPTGFLMQKQIKEYALAGATHEYTSMPIDFPYRKLLIKALIPAYGADVIFDTIKLSEDNDRKIPFNHSIYDIIRAIVGQGRPYRETVLASIGGSSGNFYCTPTYQSRVVATLWEVENQDKNIVTIDGEGGKGQIYADGTITGVNTFVEGWLPHGVIEIPFGLQDDPTDWYDVTRLGSLKLDILGYTGRTENCQIFLQQHRAY